MVSYYDTAKLNHDSEKVFVRNLRSPLTHRDFCALFTPFGQVFTCKLAVTSKGDLKGYGYVQFADQTSARRALKEFADAANTPPIMVEQYLSKPRDPGYLFPSIPYYFTVPPPVYAPMDEILMNSAAETGLLHSKAKWPGRKGRGRGRGKSPGTAELEKKVMAHAQELARGVNLALGKLKESERTELLKDEKLLEKKIKEEKAKLTS